ncbi:DUF6037 family protein [Bacillus subtilis]|uniref:DUF6037 family protein n=1 Tax=Bacillus subtilis TaxID=1423 RepID=UPI001040A22C|nr:DUF6037 family protein [Bacillus subtilis]QBJ81223.1 hypothetical protein DL538_03870 [Bacillus subtilis subsp. subtilis]QHL56962.1 hypothetical protein C7M23_04109 [Bacillus subtilis]
MGANILLKNLFALSKSMKRENLDYQVINDIKYKKDLMICALFKFDYMNLKNKAYDDKISQKEFMLGLFKKRTNEYLHLPLNHRVSENFEAFELPKRLDEDLYKQLRDFLEINYSENGEFRPVDFFNALNIAIPTKASDCNLNRKVCSYSYPTTNDNEREKIYFYRFRDNDKRGEKRSLENYEKTQKLLPYANEIIGGRNISVCFTDTPKDIDKEKEEMKSKIKSI